MLNKDLMSVLRKGMEPAEDLHPGAGTSHYFTPIACADSAAVSHPAALQRSDQTSEITNSFI